jgi:formate dehydrogenase major subunit
MQEITLTINGQAVKGKVGDTVLQICRANGIYVPSLCHLEGTSDVAACRLCLVEVQGERKAVPACTYAARDGIIVKTDNPQIAKYRKEIIELLFAERNHFCMFCEQSGDCELQSLAYHYQMENIRYQELFPRLPVDTVSSYLAIDHNRCVLCGRCVRVCKDVAALRTLDFSGRGGQTMITADINQPLGESSCTSCGSCFQACPTGAIISKSSLFKARTKEMKTAATICQGCDIGCEINVLTKDENAVRIETPDRTGTRGALCRIGRFDLLNEKRQRVTSPMLRGADGHLKNCTLDEALNAAARKFVEWGANVGGVVSSGYSNETITAFQKLMSGTLKSNSIDTLDGKDSRLISSGIRQYANGAVTPEVDPDIAGLLKADCIMVIGINIDRSHPVVGNLIRRAVTQNHAKLIVVDPNQDVFPLWSHLWLRPETGTDRVLINGLSRIVINNKKSLAEAKPELFRLLSLYEADKVTAKTTVSAEHLQEAAQMLSESKNCYIIYGKGLSTQNDPEAVTALMNLTYLAQNGTDTRMNLTFLKPNINSQGAWDLGVSNKDIKTQQLRGLYLMLGSETPDKEWLDWLKSVKNLVVQAAYHSPAVEMADVVIPSAIWSERGGTYVTAGKRTVQAQPVVIRAGSVADEEILQRLTQKISVMPGRN